MLVEVSAFLCGHLSHCSLKGKHIAKKVSCDSILYAYVVLHGYMIYNILKRAIWGVVFKNGHGYLQSSSAEAWHHHPDLRDLACGATKNSPFSNRRLVMGEVEISFGCVPPALSVWWGKSSTWLAKEPLMSGTYSVFLDRSYPISNLISMPIDSVLKRPCFLTCWLLVKRFLTWLCHLFSHVLLYY